MKMKYIAGAALTVGLLLTGAGCATEKENPAETAKLEAGAKITIAIFV